MKRVPAFLKNIFAALLLLLSTNSFANHLVGMDFFYTYVSGNTYKITLIAYADCGSSSLPSYGALPTNAPAVYIYNGDSYVTTINLSVQAPATGVEITPVCPPDLLLTQCTNVTYAIPGIKKFVYSANYTFSGPSTAWRFLFTGDMGGSYAGRATSITNISGSPVTSIQLVDTLDNSTSHNSSPDLTVIPTPFFCSDNTDNYNPGAIDPDGDSLKFFLVGAMNGTDASTPGGPVTYLSGFSGTSPLAATSFSFDPRTGQMSFFPSLQRSLVVYNIEEHRAGGLVGTSQREMTFLVLTCTNPPASAGISTASGGTIDDSTHFHMCANSGAFSFHLNPTETDALNDITVTAAGLPTGATFVVTGNGTPTPHATFSWTSTGTAPGVYTFFVTYTDNNCPLAGEQTLAYTVTIAPQPTVTATILSAASCTKKGAISIVPAGSGSPWLVDVSTGTDTVQTFPAATGTFTDSIVGGSYTVTIYSSPHRACSAFTTITLAVPATPALTPTFVSPTYCGNNDGKIILYHLTPGAHDTVNYTYNGVAHAPVVYTVATDSTVTITGLTAGVYTGITASTGIYCVSPVAGPLTLTNPPFTMRTLTSVNPIFCGICNGSITLYGLHPGQTDTLNYTIDGVSQPPVVHTIGTDSTIALTGLCAGTYTAFTANTDGDCISNILGPVTLSVPPFTMRALSSVNPSYCGICNGTITIYGLHPGGSDTITYTYGGVPQTPIHITVGTDSTATLTGLCAGVYDNFIAHAGASCVSNTLGPVTLTVPPFTMRSLTSVNPDYCGICNGSITIHGLHPGETDSIHYTYGGAAQTPFVALVGTDSTITLTGLCAGVYANFIAHTGGTCVSNTLGPVTLTVPPFTMRSVTFTNPDYCGICNGTITLHGLHPGETDSIHYTYNGAAQTPVVQLIGSDSTVTLTGLCEGVYANFIAHTAGVCVSNTLGPVTLTVPPFTMRALDHTNPDYCGICNGTVTLYGLHPGETDTITYTKDGGAQPQVVFTIPTDSSVTITDLCAGTYDNFVAKTGGICVSNTLGPVDLTVPPFTMRSVTFTNPTKCGFCNGIVTLHGLHPGETDTITYNFNGTAQPQLSFAIGADSTAVIYDLCEGTYDNFVARTGGVCVSNVLGPITLKAPPIIPDFSFTVGQNCKGDTLYCTNSSWPASDLTYIWSFGDGDSSTAINPMHIYYSPGTYNIVLNITNTKCIADTTESVTLTNLINAGFTSDPAAYVCQKSPVVFTNTSTGTSLNYTWIFGDEITDHTRDVTHTYNNTGVYNVILAVSNYVPCYDTVKETLAVDSISAISINATDTTICEGTSITYDGIFSDLGNIGVVWSFGDGDIIKGVNPVLHVFDAQGVHTVTVEALYRACPDTSASATFTIFGHPNVYLGSDTSICPGSEAIAIGNRESISGASWLWSTGQTTEQINVVEPGTYYAIATVNGCTSSDTIEVRNDCYMNIPNVFTPNGDGLNDYFFPRQLLTAGLTTFSMQIFNRWGQLIFTSTSLDGRGWDGRLNDVPQPEGVYVFIIDATFKDGQREHHQGNITLLR